MNLKFYQVSLTYAQRWSVWILAAAFAVTCGLAIQKSWFRLPVELQTDVYQRMINVTPDFPQPQPVQNVVSQQLDTVNRDCRSIFWNVNEGQPRETPISRPFLKLTSLQVVGSLKTVGGLECLSSMPNVTAFSLLGEVTANDLERISQLTQLRYLRLSTVDGIQDLTPLRRLEQLQVLDVLQVSHYPRLFEELRHLPRLRTLVIAGQVASVFRPEDWSRLHELPHLQKLYLRGNLSGPINNRMELNQVQRILPWVKVRPSTVVEYRATALSFLAIGSVLIWGLLSMQLQLQFAHVGSRLIPHYATHHIRMAVGIWSLTTLIGWIILWRGDCAAPASLAACLFFPGLLSWWTAPLLKPTGKGNQATALNPLFGICLGLPILTCTPVLTRYFLSDIDWFLQGHQPILAGLVIVTSLIGGALVLQRLPRLYCLYQECAAGTPPLGVSMKAWSTWSKNMASAQPRRRGLMNALDPVVRLDTILASRPATPKQGWSRLWNAANGIDMAQVCVRLVLVLALGLGTSYGLVSQSLFDLDWPQIERGAGTMGWFLLEAGSLGLILIWRGRRPFLSYELLRPFSRQQFVRQLFRAVFSNLAPLLLIQIAGIGALIYSSNHPGAPRLFIPAVLCYWLFRGLCLYLAILYMLSTPRDWIVVMGSLLLYLGDLMIVVYLLLAWVNPGNTLNEIWYPELTISLLLGGCAAAFYGVHWLKGYWQRIELA